MVAVTDRLILAKVLSHKSVALILAGGRGSRLKDLTLKRAKPALHFGGKFRIIDFALSNCLNSGINRIGVITQYQSHSLIQHIQKGWSFLNHKMNHCIDLLPAQQRLDDKDSWYRGTADAVYQNLDIIKNYHAEYVVILAGDHIYKMDYSLMILDHVEKKSMCTVACIAVPINQASSFGVMEISDDYKIINFLEKPSFPPHMPGNPHMALASMGIYIFNTQYLCDLLEADKLNTYSTHDFGNDLIPAITAKGEAWAHSFHLSCVTSSPEASPYWRDVGTLEAFWAANLDIAAAKPKFDIYDSKWPIYSHIESLPPTKYVQDILGGSSVTANSLVCDGCVILGSEIISSVLFANVRVDSFCLIENTVLLPGVQIGRFARLRNCVIDRSCRIPEGMVIGESIEEDEKRFYRSPEGIVLVTKKMLERIDQLSRESHYESLARLC